MNVLLDRTTTENLPIITTTAVDDNGNGK